jgi:hypothetical protein
MAAVDVLSAPAFDPRLVSGGPGVVFGEEAADSAGFADAGLSVL